MDRLAADGTTVGALMTNEMGGFATVNGLLQSAVTGLPLVDAACNGRAHPTGPMGSIGLSQDAESVQAAVGGVPGTASRLETVVEAELGTAASLVRHAASTRSKSGSERSPPTPRKA
ncbi:S-methyl thiohydantoin desulfurase domain-containing protein, partial [Haloferax volcanii]|uniref:S-methyl thiohydantoin desulfurase domain-containing protein n=1 Tax=Haloferax volcanii TaxID=2246 RepID=UPI0021BD140C